MKLFTRLATVVLFISAVTCEDDAREDSSIIDNGNSQAFLLRLKPKAGAASRASKLMLLVQLSDSDSGHEVESSETLASSASTSGESEETVPTFASYNIKPELVIAASESKYSSASQQQTTSDTEIGFEDQQRDNRNRYSVSQAPREEQVTQEKDDSYVQQKDTELSRDEQRKSLTEDDRQTQEQEASSKYSSESEARVPVLLIAFPKYPHTRYINRYLPVNADADASKQSGVNPQKYFPRLRSGFGGFGNSHTPSPAGGYGSVAMRLAAKGIPAPTAYDVERPEILRSILKPIMTGSGGVYSTKSVQDGAVYASKGAASYGTKGASRSVAQAVDSYETKSPSSAPSAYGGKSSPATKTAYHSSSSVKTSYSATSQTGVSSAAKYATDYRVSPAAAARRVPSYSSSNVNSNVAFDDETYPSSSTLVRHTRT